MEFVAVVLVLRGAIAPKWSISHVSLAHRASFGTCVLAHHDGLGVDVGHKFSFVNGLCNSLTGVFAKQVSQLPALIELPMGNMILNCVRTFSLQTGKEIVLTVDTECFRCDGKCHNLQVGESGNNTTMRDISTLVYLISCKLFADFMDFSELCNEVVNSDDRA